VCKAFVRLQGGVCTLCWREGDRRERDMQRKKDECAEKYINGNDLPEPQVYNAQEDDARVHTYTQPYIILYIHMIIIIIMSNISIVDEVLDFLASQKDDYSLGGDFIPQIDLNKCR